MLLTEITYNEGLVVACDADGVLVNFEGGCERLTGQPWTGKPPWGAISRCPHPFFEQLEKMPDADQLWGFIEANFINRFVLTAYGHTPKDAEAQKRRWFAREYPKAIMKGVVSSEDKVKFAGPNVILIDDRSKSIDPWVAAGGIGILHRNAATTIRELQRLIREHSQPARV